MKLIVFARATIIAIALFTNLAVGAADAAVITRLFSGTANGGTGSGSLTFDDHGGGTSLTVRIDNTSPNVLNSGSGLNSSIITGWGFSVTPNLPTVTSWSVIAGNGTNLTSSYSLSYNVSVGGYGGGGQLSVEDFTQTTNGINAGIYNAASPGNTANTFPDVAIFTLNFCAPFTLQQIDVATLRMQRVGTNGAGSLKLLGYAAQTYAAPEPSSLLLILFGFSIILYLKPQLRWKSCALKSQQA